MNHKRGIRANQLGQTGCQPGFQIVQIYGLILLALMISALAIDFGYYYAMRNTIHTAADSAALAAATELVRNTDPSPKVKMNEARIQAQRFLRQNQPNISLQAADVIFGYVDPTSKVYRRETFATPTLDPHFASTNGYNGVWVKVRKDMDSPNGPLNTLMANMIGIHQMNLEATAVAMVDQGVNTIQNGGLRPIYICEAQLSQAMADGILENNLLRIYPDHVEMDGQQGLVDCPSLGSGNWSFADFTGCESGNPGAGTLQDWLTNGYRGVVKAGQCYGTVGGDFMSGLSGEIDHLIANGTVFPAPLFQKWAGSGARANVTVSGFVGLKLTRLVDHGPQNARYIEGRFQRYLCNNGCSSNGPTTSMPDGSVIKLRLASRS